MFKINLKILQKFAYTVQKTFTALVKLIDLVLNNLC